MSHLKPIPKNTNSWFLEFEDILQHETSKRRDLLLSILATKSLKRSSKQGLIFVMGCSGVGKSSTINNLFNLDRSSFEEIAQTSDCRSETMKTQEYLLQADCEDYEVSDITLGIVDTPGFEDTNGMKQEACNMFSIKQFMKTNPNFDGNFPNLIIICFDATDVRFQGDNSNFANLMKCINKLKLVDQINPNVVAVITKCCSLKPDFIRKEKEWIKKIEWLMSEVEEIIETYLHVKVPVVILENDNEENLPRPKTNDGRDSDFVVLPTGDSQPLNLYQACQDVLDKSKDEFGKICFNTAFMKGKAITPKEGHHIEAKDATISELNRKEKKLLVFLEDTNKSITKNKIKKKSEKYINDMKTNSSQNDNENTEVKRISKKHNNNLGLFSKEHMKTSSLENGIAEVKRISKELNILGLFSNKDLKYVTNESLLFHLNFKPSPFAETFITKHLKLEKYHHQSNQVLTLSRGYHVYKDSLCAQIHEFPTTQERYGLPIPINCKFTKMKIDKHYGEFVTDQTDLFEKRISYLDFRDFEMNPNPENMQFNGRPGFQIGRSLTEVKSDKKNDEKEIKFEYFERCELQIDITDCKLDFCDKFKEFVEKLPTEDDSDNSNCYIEFFEKFGHFSIDSAYFGGSYENIKDFTGCKGGHKDFQSTELTCDNKKKWIASIMTNPIMLTTKMTLKPIFHAVEEVNPKKAKGVERALKDLFHLNEEELKAENPDNSTIETKGKPILTRKEAVEDNSAKNSKLFNGIMVTILFLLGIGLFPITIIVAIVMKAKLGRDKST